MTEPVATLERLRTVAFRRAQHWTVKRFVGRAQAWFEVVEMFDREIAQCKGRMTLGRTNASRRKR